MSHTQAFVFINRAFFTNGFWPLKCERLVSQKAYRLIISAPAPETHAGPGYPQIVFSVRSALHSQPHLTPFTMMLFSSNTGVIVILTPLVILKTRRDIRLEACISAPFNDDIWLPKSPLPTSVSAGVPVNEGSQFSRPVTWEVRTQTCRAPRMTTEGTWDAHHTH